MSDLPRFKHQGGEARTHRFLREPTKSTRDRWDSHWRTNAPIRFALSSMCVSLVDATMCVGRMRTIHHVVNINIIVE